MKKRYWWVIITYILMQFSIYIAIPFHNITGIEKPLDIWLEEIQGIWAVWSFSIGLLIILYILRQDIKDRHLNERRSSRLSALGWAVAGVFLAFIAQMVAGIIEINILGIEPGSKNTEVIVEIAKKTPLFLLAGALIGPILEEIIFRKIIFGTLYKKYNFLLAGLISSFVFAIIHIDFTHILIYLAAGFTFAFLYVKTERLLVPIIAHSAMNAIVFTLNMYEGEITDYLQQLEQTQSFIGGIF